MYEHGLPNLNCEGKCFFLFFIYIYNIFDSISLKKKGVFLILTLMLYQILCPREIA